MARNSKTNRLKCPKCHHGMEEVSYEDITIDRCTGCGGLWFDGDEAQRLKNMPGSDRLDSGDPKTGRMYDRHADINCPRCGKAMEKSADWKQVHIWYETCRDHGIFMDAGEFTDFKHETLFDRFRELIKGTRKT